MSAYESIVKGLNEAIEYEHGNKKSAKKRQIRISSIPRYEGKGVKDIRLKLMLPQSAFADILGVSKKTVESWEAGKNTPQGPAQRMLDLLQNDSSLTEKYLIFRD